MTRGRQEGISNRGIELIPQNMPQLTPEGLSISFLFPLSHREYILNINFVHAIEMNCNRTRRNISLIVHVAWRCLENQVRKKCGYRKITWTWKLVNVGCMARI